MNIVVYCGSTPVDNQAYIQAARDLGAWIAQEGHTLVWGGCKTGLMGEVADAAVANQGRVIGVLPDVESIRQRMYPHMTEVVFTTTMAQRKSTMIEMADAFVALPGGVGTLDEISDIFALIRLGIVTQPVVMVNAQGFYEPLRAQFDCMVQAGYMNPGDPQGVLFSDDIREISAHIMASCCSN